MQVNQSLTQPSVNKIAELLKNRMVLLGLIIVAEVVIFAMYAPYFFTMNNGINILKQISEIGIIGITLSFLLISGHMDLSVGSIVGICSITGGMLLRAGYPIAMAFAASIAVGAMVGLLNGLIVGYLKIQAVVVTIGTQVLFRGVCYIVTEGRAVSGYPTEFFKLNSGRVFGVPYSVIALVFFYIVGWFVLEKTYMGRYIVAIGNNQNTVKYTGVNVARAKVALFIASGVMTAIASMFLIARLSSAEATLGSGYELDVITAALIGGVDINGGKGQVQGTLLGVLIIGILRNGLNLMGMSTIYQSIVLGVLLLLVVAKRKSS